MKKIRYIPLLFGTILMISWMSISYAQSGATYYITLDGSGDTITLSELNSADLQPGDVVLFERGGIYGGSLNLSNLDGTAAAPITFGAYGAGDAPIISGLTAVTNWQETSPNIWSATCSACSDTMLNMVLIDGDIQPLARYPNLDDTNADEGYLYWDSFSGKTQITDSVLQTPSQIDWTGGELVARTRLWILDRRPITNHTNRTLTVTFPPPPHGNYVPGDSDYDYRAGYGYFIQNHPAALDQQGEWTYNSNTITLYHTGNPNNQTIMATAQEKVVLLDRANHVIMENIDIVGGNTANIGAADANHLTFDNVDLYNAGNVAADIARATFVEYRNSEISDALNFGLKAHKCNDCSLHDNHIHDIALFAGMGQGRDGQYNGALAYGQNILFESNIVERVGYLGISGRGVFEIRNNRVSDFGRVKTDGGGIYSFGRYEVETATSIIADNVVYNGIGSVAGTDRDISGVQGIYLDDGIENIIVTGNVMVNLSENGIKLHNTSDLTIEDNTVIDAHIASIRYADDNNFVYDIDKNLMQNNTFVSVDAGSVIVEANTNDGTAGFRNFGDIDNNKYCYNGTFMRQLYAGTPRSISDWRAYNHDENTTTCTTTNKVRNSTFDSNMVYWFGYHKDNLTLTVDNGALKAAGVPGNPAWRHFETTVGEITAGKTYYASYDIRTDQDDVPIDLYLRKHRAPYNKLTDVQTELIGTKSRTIGHLFTPTTSELDSSLLVFEVDSSVQTVWVDNVVLYELPDDTTSPPPVVPPIVPPSAPPLPIIYDFETDSGWTVNPNGTDTATTGQWERVDPEKTEYEGNRYQNQNAAEGDYALVTGGAAGDSVGANDIDNGTTSIRSPQISLPAGYDLTISFSLYLAHYSNSTADDYLRLSWVSNGTTTTLFEEKAAGDGELAISDIDQAFWGRDIVRSLSDFAGQTGYLLVEAADGGSASLVEAAIDDIRIKGAD